MWSLDLACSLFQSRATASLCLGSPPRGLHPFPEAGQKHARTRTPPMRGRGRESARALGGEWVRLRRAAVTGQPAELPVGAKAVSSPLRWRRASGLSTKAHCCGEGECNGTAGQGRPVGTVLGIWASTQMISVLDGRAGLLCETGFTSLWLLGSPGSLPGHAVPIRALGPKEIR